MFFSFITLSELALLILGAMLMLHRWEYSFAHACSMAIVVTLLALSLTFQITFLLGIPGLSFMVEGVFAMGAIVMIFINLHRLVDICTSLLRFMHYRKVMSILVVICIVYLGLQAVLLPEGNYDSMRYNLTRVLLFQQEHSMFLTNITEYHQAVLPVGGDILSHLFLRYYTDYGLATISLLAYVSIVFGAYALARCYASSYVAWTVMLIVMSLPLLVRQATGTKPDILITSVVVLCLLCAERLLRRPNLCDGLLLILGLSFGVSIKTTFIAFLIPFALLFTCLFLMKHGMWAILGFFKRRWLPIILVVPLVLVFSQFWLFLHNLIYWGHWAGPIEFVNFHRNQDGLGGTVANLIRYGVQSLHLMTPTDVLSEWLSGVKISDLLERVYELVLYPLIGDYGAAWSHNIVPFVLSDWSWGDGENGAWFGPLGFLFIIPALFYAMMRGSSYVRMTGVVLVVYAVILSWQIAWMPWNGRFFGPVFVGGAGCLGFLLARWQTVLRLQALRIVALSILVYCCIFNQAKLLVGADPLRQSVKQFTLAQGLFDQGIWAQTRWGCDRFHYARRYYGNNRVEEFVQVVKPNARVAVTSQHLGWLFHYMLYRPDVSFVPVFSKDQVTGKALGADSLEGFDYLLCINRSCDEFFLPERHELLLEYKPEKQIWEVPIGEYVRPGGLIRL